MLTPTPQSPYAYLPMIFHSRLKRSSIAVMALIVIAVTHAPAHCRSHKKTRTVSPEDLAAVSAPKDQEVCFSPEESCDLKLIKLVQSAKTTIDVAVYDISLEMLAHQLLTQLKKIRIRILVDKRQSK